MSTVVEIHNDRLVVRLDVDLDSEPSVVQLPITPEACNNAGGKWSNRVGDARCHPKNNAVVWSGRRRFKRVPASVFFISR